MVPKKRTGSASPNRQQREGKSPSPKPGEVPLAQDYESIFGDELSSVRSAIYRISSRKKHKITYVSTAFEVLGGLQANIPCSDSRAQDPNQAARAQALITLAKNLKEGCKDGADAASVNALWNAMMTKLAEYVHMGYTTTSVVEVKK